MQDDNSEEDQEDQIRERRVHKNVNEAGGTWG